MKIKIKKLDPKAVIPRYALEGDAGMDLIAIGRFIDEYGNICYNTGLAIQIPEGYEGQLRPRSSIRKYDLALANAPGTIDSNYRGELLVVFKASERFNLRFQNENNGAVEYATLFNFLKVYEVGDRICQLVIKPVPHIDLVEVDELDNSNRGSNGFGSTGISTEISKIP